jgi:hypothetical protein
VADPSHHRSAAAAPARLPTFAVAAAGVVLLVALGWWRWPADATDPYGERNFGGPGAVIHSAKLAYGDDPRFADPLFDDSSWTDTWLSRLPRHAGVFWVRARVELQKLPHTGRFPEAFLGAANAAQEVYWNGRRIGEAGIVGGSKAAEVPGPNEKIYALPPDDRGPGPHLLALRMSSYWSEFPTSTFAYLNAFGTYADLSVRNHRQALLTLAVGGVGLVVGAFCLLVFLLIERRGAFALFAAFGFGVGAVGALMALRSLSGFSYAWFWPLLAASAWANVVAGAALGLSLLAFFRLPQRGWWLVLLLVPAAAGQWAMHPVWFVRGWWQTEWALLLAAVLGLMAWNLRRRGALWVAAGAAAGWAFLVFDDRPYPGNFADPWVAVPAAGGALALFTALGVQVRDEQLRLRQSQLASARLEGELLKRSLQPNLLLHSLRTLGELVERRPRDAVRMIAALVEEFRILGTISAETSIPVSRELELCDSHLRVISVRHGAELRLDTENIDPLQAVPPAVFHTLVEEAAARLPPAAGAQIFRLVESHGVDGRRRYELFTPARPAGNEDAVLATTAAAARRYLHARLEESYPGRWVLESGPVRDGWRTLIEILPPRAA